MSDKLANRAFPWPPTEKGAPLPTWDGTCFRVGSEQRDILAYSHDESAWDVSLTEFHEAAANSDHPIDLASRRLALAGLKRYLFDPAVILEVGSSSGFLLPLLREAFPTALVIGSDAFPETLTKLAARREGYPLLQFDLTRCPLPDATVDGLVALNVLEHIRDDAAAFKQIARVLKPGGLAYVEVPAGARLYDVYDELLRHYRRYHEDRIVELALQAGLQPTRVSHLGCLAFPFFAAVKKRNQRRPFSRAEAKRADVARSIGASRTSRALALTLRVEERLGRLLRFPFGIRCVCVLQKGV